ncbi:hypothetical protein SAMD00079811_33030 [Scytonema sp. HK-05]|nr:hypothetical protein SAMD00079811_33030 [Scytonema sp. HK-05]
MAKTGSGRTLGITRTRRKTEVEGTGHSVFGYIASKKNHVHTTVFNKRRN